MLKSVHYISFWEEGIVITSANLNLETGEITDIEASDEGQEYEHHKYDEITLELAGAEFTYVVETDGEFEYGITAVDLTDINGRI